MSTDTLSTIAYHFDLPGHSDVVDRLVRKVAQDSGQSLPFRTLLQPVPRLGKSGASVYEFSVNNGVLLALKVDSRRSIEQEINGAKCFENYIGSDAAVKADPSTTGDISGLVYNHARGESFEDAHNAPDLEEVILARPITEAETALDRLYTFARERFHHPDRLKQDNVLLGQVYTASGYDYLRTGRAETRAEEAAVRVASVVGEKRKLFGKAIVDPNKVLEALTKARLPLTVGPVHGDLHPRNVIFTAKHDNPEQLDLKKPHLIDFKWARNAGPVLVDYVLMELTLRFLWAPRCFDPAVAATINGALLAEDGTVTQPPCRYGPHAKHIERLSVLIPVVRRHAKDVVNRPDWFTEYLCCLFLLLHGLLLYPDYDARTAAHALGIMGRTLSKAGVV